MLPVAATLKYTGAPEVWLFLTCCVGIIPLAGLMGEATESLAERFGPAVGGLLNATFGNAAELIIALMVLRRGPQMYPLVKASITGSIIGNILLVLGLAILVGGLRYKRQTFNRTGAGVGTSLLALACVGLIIPTLYYYLLPAGRQLTTAEASNIVNLSEEIAIVLMVIYGLSLVFTLRTHTHLYESEEAAPPTT